jgi:hypothetical protein
MVVVSIVIHLKSEEKWPADFAEFADDFLRYQCSLREKFKLKNRIHGKRQHQQGIVVALISKTFMWIIWNHALQI